MAHTLDYAKNPPAYTEYKKRGTTKFPEDKMISEKEFNLITKNECHYCGKEGPNGIDRVNNKKGYTIDNCVACCKHCNYVKGDLTMKDFKKWTVRFIKKQNENNNLEL